MMADPSRREQAALRWVQWEDAVLSLEPNAKPGLYSNRSQRDVLAFVRICSHYFANTGWLEDNQLLRRADHLKGIPGVIIHGRLDLSAPLVSAWGLARAWPEAKFHSVLEGGHQGNPSSRALMLQAHAAFARTRPA